jgi:hypothetical protein
MKRVIIGPAKSEGIPQFKASGGSNSGGGAGFIKFYRWVAEEMRDASYQAYYIFYRYGEIISRYRALGNYGWNTQELPNQSSYNLVNIPGYPYQIKQTQQTFEDGGSDDATEDIVVVEQSAPSRYGILPVQGEVFRNSNFQYNMELYLVQFIPYIFTGVQDEANTLGFDLYMVGGGQQPLLKGDYQIKITYYNAQGEATVMYDDTHTFEGTTGFGGELRVDQDVPHQYSSDDAGAIDLTYQRSWERLPTEISSEFVFQTLKSKILSLNRDGNPVPPQYADSPTKQVISEIELRSNLLSSEQLTNLLGGSGFVDSDRFKIEILGFTPAQ